MTSSAAVRKSGFLHILHEYTTCQLPYLLPSLQWCRGFSFLFDSFNLLNFKRTFRRERLTLNDIFRTAIVRVFVDNLLHLNRDMRDLLFVCSCAQLCMQLAA